MFSTASLALSIIFACANNAATFLALCQWRVKSQRVHKFRMYTLALTVKRVLAMVLHVIYWVHAASIYARDNSVQKVDNLCSGT
jgi:Tfp pilus assembly protein PilN